MSNFNKTQQNLPFDGQMAIIWLNINIWTGKTRLSSEDIKLGNGGSLPPAQLASLGSKNLINPEKLRIFHRLKQRAVNTILSYGLPFVGGYAIPKAKEKNLLDALAQIQTEFDQARVQFISELDSNVQQWIKENPEWEDSIRSVKINPAKISTRLNYEFASYMVANSGDGGGEKLLEAQASGLAGNLIEEVRDTAEKLYQQSFCGKDYVNSRTLPPLVNLKTKVDGLLFLNSSLSGLSEKLKEAIEAYNHTIEGRLYEPHLSVVTSTLLVLADQDRIKEFAQASSSENVEDEAADPVEDVDTSEIEGFFADSEESKEPEKTEESQISLEIAQEAIEELDEELEEFLSNNPQVAEEIREELEEASPAQQENGFQYDIHQSAIF